MAAGRVAAVSVSDRKGVKKTNVPQARVLKEHGLEGDAHAGDWHRQVSLLGRESIEKMRALGVDVVPGDFAENITTEGLDVPGLPVGTRIRVGRDVVLELTQIGKACHTGCAIMKAVGKCVMPTEGVFFRVLVEGVVTPGDEIVVLEAAECL